MNSQRLGWLRSNARARAIVVGIVTVIAIALVVVIAAIASIAIMPLGIAVAATIIGIIICGVAIAVADGGVTTFATRFIADVIIAAGIAISSAAIAIISVVNVLLHQSSHLHHGRR